MSLHLKKLSRVFILHQLDIGSEAFKQAFATHRNAMTTAVMRNLNTIDCDGRERKGILKEDLQKQGEYFGSYTLL